MTKTKIICPICGKEYSYEEVFTLDKKLELLSEDFTCDGKLACGDNCGCIFNVALVPKYVVNKVGTAVSKNETIIDLDTNEVI